MSQPKQKEWFDQWSAFEDNERFLFEDWIYPNTLDDFAGKQVLEAGCGGGLHTLIVAEVANWVTAVDLNTTDIAKKRLGEVMNVEFIEEDIGTMDLGKTFDVVFCVGVIHHTDNPTRTFENLYRHVCEGGKLLIWAYSAEGNSFIQYCIEPIKKIFLRKLPRKVLIALSWLLTSFLYTVVYTVYRFEFCKFLPYYSYFKNFRRLSFLRNVLNIFDKLNAPQTIFITRKQSGAWFSPDRFCRDSIHISHYADVSYRLSGTKIISESS